MYFLFTGLLSRITAVLSFVAIIAAPAAFGNVQKVESKIAFRDSPRAGTNQFNQIPEQEWFQVEA